LKLLKRKKAEKEDPDFKIEERAPDSPEEIVLFYFRNLINMKQKLLDDRNEDEKKKVGKVERI